MAIAESIITFIIIIFLIGVCYPLMKQCRSLDFRIKVMLFFNGGGRSGERLQEDETEDNTIMASDRIATCIPTIERPPSPPPPYDWSTTAHEVTRPVFVIPRYNTNTTMSSGEQNRNFVMLSQGRQPPSYDSIWTTTTGILNEHVSPPPYS